MELTTYTVRSTTSHPPHSFGVHTLRAWIGSQLFNSLNILTDSNVRPTRPPVRLGVSPILHPALCLLMDEGILLARWQAAGAGKSRSLVSWLM